MKQLIKLKRGCYDGRFILVSPHTGFKLVDGAGYCRINNSTFVHEAFYDPVTGKEVPENNLPFQNKKLYNQ